MLSTLDWALIETWRDAGVPLEVVLCGIDEAFDKHDAQRMRAAGGGKRVRKVNGLAWAAASVMRAAETAAEAATGVGPGAAAELRESGFEAGRIRSFLEGRAAALESAGVQLEIARRLRELAAADQDGRLEELDRTLTVLEEKMLAGLMAEAPEEELTLLREQSARELAPYRGKMQAVQIRQVQQQFLQKQLLEARGLPRLSLFYMKHEGEKD